MHQKIVIKMRGDFCITEQLTVPKCPLYRGYTVIHVHAHILCLSFFNREMMPSLESLASMSYQAKVVEIMAAHVHD
uniref:Uncharacterized protein n=1 Tax=Amphimedon queenslandica TaxID=400682 RepID=A0A1X7TP55_AMPQE